MKLLKIGRDMSNDIVLQSNRVSSLHAEITLLDSGDIQLEDKGSSNGTYVMNQPIAPGKPVNIRRGDAVRFADVELQWSQVPMPEDNSAYKGIYGVGSNFNNDIQISGATVSRYHATVKQARDGKMYIVDHSKNGTTVDGVKIQKDVPYRIKKNSSVVCGGVPVDLSRLPWKSSAGKTVLAIAASVIVLAGITFGLIKLLGGGSSNPSIKALTNATAQVYGTFFVDVTVEDDPFIGKINGWPSTWVFGVDSDGDLALQTLNSSTDIEPLGYSGTAFFISDKGELGTNRHIALPWEYSLTAEQRDNIKQTMVIMFSNQQSRLYQTLVEILEQQITSYAELYDAQARLQRLANSPLRISGHFSYLGVALAGTTYSTIADLHACQVIAESGDDRKDVALLRLNSKKTPEEIVKDGYFNIENARVDETTLRPQEEELTIIGYPSERNTGIALVSNFQEIIPVVHRSYISKAPDNEMFQLQSNVVGGQSGSPIIDKNRNLVGVLWGSHRTTDVAYGCNIKHLKELYDKNKARN